MFNCFGDLWRVGSDYRQTVFAAIQVALIVMDYEERILADEFTLGGILVGLVFAAFVPMPIGILQLLLPPDWSRRLVSVLESGFSAAVLSAMLFFIATLYEKLRGREGLGFGDVKMVGMIGAILNVAGILFGGIFGLTRRKPLSPRPRRSIAIATRRSLKRLPRRLRP